MRTMSRERKTAPFRWLLPLWLSLDVCAIAAFATCRGNRALMNAWTGRVAGPLQAALGRMCARVPFSVMEAAITALVLCAAVRAVRGAVRGRFAVTLFGGVCAGLCLTALFCWMWGVYYWSDGFQDLSGLYAAPVSAEQLRTTAEAFAAGLSRAADAVPRDEYGAFALSRTEILAKAPRIYDNLERAYPCLAFDDTGVKPMAYSRLMSRMDFTGFYCACTGEANVNVDSPACLLASTAAHEMAHQRGFASEQECNFLAVLACVTSGEPVYAYSGWLMGWIYLGNALYSADPDTYARIRDTLPATVRTDLARNNAYWDQFRNGVVRKASAAAYDRILKGYGDGRGMRSYGAVVDLLVAYHCALR